MSAAGTCPSCGAPLRFGAAESLALVCSYCRSAVVRAGAELQLIGKVPDLVATGSRLALGAAGELNGAAFTVVGHLQLGHRDAKGNADGVWDEWHVSFPGGGWGWLAEAQGHLLFTRPTPLSRPPPRFGALHAGSRIPNLPGAGPLVVDEVNEASFVAAEGELPFRPAVGATYRFADCSTREGAFVTLDYGSEGDEPEMFAGREVSYADAGLAQYQRPFERAPEGRAMACPNCNGPLSLKLAATESMTCPSCHGLLDVSSPHVKLLKALQQRAKPPLPLGARGKLDGTEYEVVGWMRRAVHDDGADWPWDEYLLHGNPGYRWLTESNGHWHFLWPVPAGKVEEESGAARCDGRRFRLYQRGAAKYVEMQGEFYWRVEAGAAVDTRDFIAPPFILSKEETQHEVNWSRGEYIPGAKVWQAFAQPGSPPAATGVGAAQPNMHAQVRERLWGICLCALGALLALALLLSNLHPRRQALDMQVPVQNGQVALSEPFELTGGPQAIELIGDANVEQAWVGLDAALINDDTGESDAVGIELSHYYGYDDEGSWSEGSPRGSAIIGRVSDGRYVLRVEPVTETSPGGRLPAMARVTVWTGAFLVGPLLLALACIFAVPVWVSWQAWSFEKQRWDASDSPWGSS